MTARCEPARTRRQLSSARRRLIQLMQTYSFCRLRGMKVLGGEPVLDDDLEIIHDLKINGSNGPRPELALTDFVLRDEHVELFRHLDEIEDGVIEEIEIKYGLPCRLYVKRRLA